MTMVGSHSPTYVHIHRYACKGRMVALLGPSGAGKTTLLDVLANKKTGGTITGEVNRWVAVLLDVLMDG